MTRCIPPIAAALVAVVVAHDDGVSRSLLRRRSRHGSDDHPWTRLARGPTVAAWSLVGSRGSLSDRNHGAGRHRACLAEGSTTTQGKYAPNHPQGRRLPRQSQLPQRADRRSAARRSLYLWTRLLDAVSLAGARRRGGPRSAERIGRRPHPGRSNSPGAPRHRPVAGAT